MKKMMFWFAACLLISGIVLAQKTDTAKSSGGVNMNRIRIGLTLSPTFSWLNVLDSAYTAEGSRLSFSYGLLFDYGFADRYALSVGLVGVPGGGNYQDSSSVNLRMRYVQLPIFLKLRTNAFGKFTPFGQVGIAPSFAISRRYDRESAGLENQNASSFTQPFNFALGGGAGVEYAIGSSSTVFAALEYQHGFLSVVESSNDKISNSNFSIKLGVYF